MSTIPPKSPTAPPTRIGRLAAGLIAFAAGALPVAAGLTLGALR